MSVRSRRIEATDYGSTPERRHEWLDICGINREIQHESKHAHAPRVHGTRAHVTPCRNVSSSVNTLLQPSLVGALDLFWMPNVAPEFT